MKKVVFKVEGMSCVHCENRVVNVLSKIKGVVVCSADAKKGQVICSYNEEEINEREIAEAIDDTGYEVVR